MIYGSRRFTSGIFFSALLLGLPLAGRGQETSPSSTSAAFSPRVVVVESKMRFDFEPQVQFVLPLSNTTNRTFPAKVEMQFLDVEDKVAASGGTPIVIEPGNFLNNMVVGPQSLVTRSPSQLATFRLKYRVVPDVPTDFAPVEGIMQMGEIMTNPYQVRVATLTSPRPGSSFPVRVRVEQPYNAHPCPGMEVTAKLEMDTRRTNQKQPKPVVRRGSTDADGYALFVFDLPPGHDYSGGKVTVTVPRGPLLEEEEAGFGYPSEPRLAISTDKPIYQPGQTVHLRAQAFGPDNYALAGADVDIEITDPDNSKAFHVELETSKFGIASADWQVPANLRLGDYGIEASLESGDWYERAERTEKIKISRYDLPDFSVQATPNFPYYTRDRSPSVKVAARYLFGEAVKQGHVRVTGVARREWNYQEQKYDTGEKAVAAGELAPNGTFVSPISLKDDFDEFEKDPYGRFQDIHFAAYVTDASTGRTEQRRFDLRITHQPIHIYLQEVFAPIVGQPAELYVTTSYADGTPASVEVSLAALKPNAEGNFDEDATHPLQAVALGSAHTNAYGVVKIRDLRVPKDCLLHYEGNSYSPGGATAYMRLEARDEHGATGMQKGQIGFVDVSHAVRLIPAKTLYRAGEDVQVEIDSKSKVDQLVVEILGGKGSLQSQAVRLTGGRGSIRFPYDPRFQGELKIQAYNMSTRPLGEADDNGREEAPPPATILFPAKQDLDLDMRLARASYRPGELAVADFSIVTAEGKPVQGALGAVVFDKAVSERVRTDEDFGGRGFGFTDYWWNDVSEESIAGITAADLLKWDSTRPYPDGLDLVAEMLMSRVAYYRGEEEPVDLSGGIYYFLDPLEDFDKIIQASLKNLHEVLDDAYKKTGRYPFTPAELRETLRQNGIDFDSLRDPWDMPYQAEFSAKNLWDILQIRSTGPDKLANTKDDFTVLTIERRNYLTSVLNADYQKTHEYPHNLAELKATLKRNGIDFDHYLDPWGTPYEARFWVSGAYDMLEIRSAGPDRVRNTPDDFTVALVDYPYFWKIGYAIDQASENYFLRTGKYVRDYATLRDELARDKIDLDALRDPWGNKYAFDFGITQNNFTITVRSPGPDGFFNSEAKPSSDDVFLWTSSTPYFQREQAAIDAALAEYYQKTGIFPDTVEKLQPVLKAAKLSLEDLTDPWGRPYYFTFNKESRYTNRIGIKSYSVYPAQPRRTTEAVPVTQQVEFIHVMSDKGPFAVANFSREVAEQTGKDLTPTVPEDRTSFLAGAGAIAGVVTDPAGAAIPGAHVKAAEEATGNSQEATAGTDGSYILRHLRPGNYTVEATAPGFMASEIVRVPVQSSSTTKLDVVLQVGAVAQSVVVQAPAPSLSMISVLSTGQTVMVLAATQRGTQRKPSAETPLFTPRLRQYFPETLLWRPETVTDPQGHAQLRFKLADNITTWTMSVVASTLDGKTGITQKEIRAFQPFFIDHDPPKILTQGDVISLPAVLRNYLPKPQAVTVEMKPQNWFALLASPHQKLTAPAGGSVDAVFPLRAVAATKQGKQRVTATNGQTGDSIERVVDVHPDGEELFETTSQILGAGQAELKFEVSEHAIKGSTEAVLKLYPNLLAHVLESVKGMVMQPTGCAEQVSSVGLANLRALRVLQKAGQDNPDAPGNPNAALARNARQYVQEAYQTLLTYQGSDGGFTYWGRGDSGFALTAHVLRFLTDAPPWVKVDEQCIRRARDFILKQQQPDGSWQSIWYKPKADLALTAYLARVLASATPLLGAQQSGAGPSVEKALHFLEDRMDEWKESYLVANYALAAMATGRADFQQKARQQLLSMAHDEGPTTYWNVELNCTPFYGWGTAGRYETTALAVQALAMLPAGLDTDGQAARQAQRGLLYLLQNKDRYGTWHSTAATVNALDAIIASIPPGKIPGQASSATVMLNGTPAATVRIPAPSEITGPVMATLPAHSVLPGANKIELRRGQDNSALLAQVVSVAYVPWEFSSGTRESNLRLGDTRALRLSVDFDRLSAGVGQPVRCTVKAERIGFQGYGMMLAEIGLPPGVDVNRGSLDAAMEEHGYDVRRYDLLPDRIVFYLWPRAGGVEFNFTFRPRFKMEASTAPSLLYDYYNPEARSLVQPVRFVVH
jgi:hypothetical protein